MKSRYLVLCLSLVLALALAVPALGGPSNPIASVSASLKQTANKALKKAKAAQKTANTALSAANGAQTSADAAQKTANSANTAAKNAQTTATAANAAAKNAQTTADAAKSAAAAAQSTADGKLGETFTEFGDGSGTKTEEGLDIAECPTGSEVTGGGYNTAGEGADQVVPSWTAAYGDAWLAILQRIPGGTKSWSVQAVVTCARP